MNLFSIRYAKQIVYYNIWEARQPPAGYGGISVAKSEIADSEVLSELKQLRGQVHDLNLARGGHDDVVRVLGDAIASLKKENAELREELGKRGVPASPVPLPRRREGAWTQVKNKETGRGRSQTPPPATGNSFAALVDECTEEGDGKTDELSLSSGPPVRRERGASLSQGCGTVGVLAWIIEKGDGGQGLFRGPGGFVKECLISGIPFALHIKNMRIFTIVPTATSAHYGTLHPCLVTTT
ncbi:hypothetical protein GWK47_014044 [Chionoecetes opilio]|uniref:Uncharacterized protein n=1 Tax=Chionoecetes opilio TaxID=41210 RepID=A0A8J5CJ59_CHIOP|nr:hypothetical protein GWK47_014044 [Chionoecetes opilio]